MGERSVISIVMYEIYTWGDWDSNLLKKWEKGLPEKLGDLCIWNYIRR